MKRWIAALLLSMLLAVGCRIPADASDASTRVEPDPMGRDPMAMPIPTPVPNKQPVPLNLGERETSWIVRGVEARRAYVIPIRSRCSIPENAMLWETRDPDAEEAAMAKETAERLTQTVFEQSYADLTGADIETGLMRVYNDPTGVRSTFFRITDADGKYDLSFRASDGMLLCADLLTIPTLEGTDREEKNLSIAGKLGHKAKPYSRDKGLAYETVYRYTTDTDVCLSFAWIGNRLWQAAVYPSEQAMNESEYFKEDVQHDRSTPAYPERFQKAESPDDTGGRILTSLCALYRELTGTAPDKSLFTATFFRDESGAREDCWTLEGPALSMTVSAYSRYVIRLSCSIPCKELVDIPYEQMGGREYTETAKQIANALLSGFPADGDDAQGKAIASIDVNSVYDLHCCTMDVTLADGTIYELGFRDGMLEYMEYYADRQFFTAGAAAGWAADALYINAGTGKPILPGCRNWDGELHVIRPDK